jgi:hypothetical protein
VHLAHEQTGLGVLPTVVEQVRTTCLDFALRKSFAAAWPPPNSAALIAN